MPDEAEIERKFWKALRADMTVMLGLEGPDAVAARPMTAQLEGDEDHGPIWFFTARQTELAQALRGESRGWFTFADKGHDLWATVTGRLSEQTDRAVIDRLWNPFVAAWYEGGKEDPALVLLRFDPEQAEIWLDKSSLLSGLKLLLGADPKQDYKDSVAKVSLR